MSQTIYDQLWECDTDGCSVASQGANGSGGSADILLNEQVRADGHRDIDLATQPLFAYVNPDKLSKPIYQALVALLDNYVKNTRVPEETDTQETDEINAFVALVLASEPMKKAQEYIANDLGFSYTDDQFRERVTSIWFELYTNHYRGKSSHWCSGFEHVFVGEGKYQPRNGNNATKGEISGYHSWVKFYLDESANRVNYLGYKYDLNGQGPDFPHVVTLQMIENHVDLTGSFDVQLFKRKGGFFVGPSPACEIAMGTVAFFESVKGLLQGDKRRTTIRGGKFDLVMYRNTTTDGKDGEYIRSFYPVFNGKSGVDDSNAAMNDRTVIEVSANAATNAAELRIAQALINPPGNDSQGEWVAIKFYGPEATRSLEGLELRDRLSRPLKLTGTIDKDETVVFNMKRIDNDSMQLSNKGGMISLHDGREMLAVVTYGKAAENEIVKFVE